MLGRILISTAAAAALLVATPALAAEGAWEKQCDCCSDGSIHDVDHPLRKARERASLPDPAGTSVTDADRNARHQSSGSCSDQPGRGVESGYPASALATTSPPGVIATALTPVVPTSSPTRAARTARRA